ncbi:Dna2/Cas4 domain-containing protein [Methanosarcina sp. DH2]|jgi:CRISPR-associated exonuclease Cas4|uniref:Dna2/Cas4 domain-containing protein n=1 Tax=Methanosarcina sp. DH2 TaxID=2605639 RepID=UPI001E3C6E3E|nr:Dna2/Cas4 domain-containing protein [Methanosarcina sp. DH2]MCC4769009.1 Dna2/Cas4 domain-containing protein [Methanosarcina sp. DH2]
MPADSRNPEISVSDLLLYINCPRRVYFVSRGFELLPEINASRLERMLLKELSLNYPEIVKKCSLNADTLCKELESALNQACEDLPLMFPREFARIEEGILEEANARARAKIPEIAANLLRGLEEYGKDPMLAALTPVKTEPFLLSEKLNLKGVPSKLVCFEGMNVPSIIKPGNCPVQGVWASDRMHVTSLALLLEAEFGGEVPFAFVEYVSFGLLRKVVIRSSDRREVLKICRRVEKIKAGFMPEKTEEKFCTECTFSENCVSNPSLMSKFF